MRFPTPPAEYYGPSDSQPDVNERARGPFIQHAMDNAQALIARMDNKAAGLVALLALLEATLGIVASVSLDEQPSTILTVALVVHVAAAIWSMIWLLWVFFAKGKPAYEQTSMCYPGDSFNFEHPEDYMTAIESHDEATDYAAQFLVLGSIFRSKEKAVNRATIGVASTIATWIIALVLMAWVG